MPQIREYQQQIGAQGAIPGRQAQASDIGGSGMSDAGDAIVQAGRVLAQHESQLEVTDAYTTAAKIQADQTVRLAQASQSADPGDSEFSQKFTDSVKEQLDAAGEKYTTSAGKQAWQKESARIAAQFVEQSGVFQAKLAGVKAQQDYQTLVDSGQITLNNDPTQFDKILKSTQDALNDPNGTYSRIPAIDKDKITRQMKEQLAVSAMEGIIRMGPELGQKMLQNNNGPAQYLSGEQQDRLKHTAEVAINAQEVEKRRVEAEMARAEKARNAAIGDQILKGIYDPNAKKKLTVNDILYGVGGPLPPMGENSKETYIKMLDSSIKTKEIKTDPVVYGRLMSGINSGQITDETPILNAFIQSSKTLSGITVEDYDRLRKEVDNYRTPDGRSLGQERETLIKQYAPEINKANPLLAQSADPTGGAEVYKYRQFIQNEMDSYRKQGKNPYDLFNPSKPDFLGRDEIIGKYQKSVADSVQTIIQGVSPKHSIGPDEVRKSGETIQQYQERLKKAK